MGEQKHLYHLVDRSPWPIITAFGILSMLLGGVMYMHLIKKGLFVLCFSLIVVLYSVSLWCRDIIREGTYEGHHTLIVQKGLRYGMILFIVSEIMFFFAFF